MPDMPGQSEWINPIGGLGDSLMLSGVLWQVIEHQPSRRFRLVRRTRYQGILAGHPAIEEIGFPPPDATIVRTDYWSREELGSGDRRAFQILARMFGLPTPVEERLYFPGGFAAAGSLENMIPWNRSCVVLIAPSSDAPRKMMPLHVWIDLVQLLRKEGLFVLQLGKHQDTHIKGAYSLLGVTSPAQAIGLACRCSAIVTVDNFFVHVAHLVGVPAVVVWGPTDPHVYGYPEQIHLKGSREYCQEREHCLGPKHPDHYFLPCPMEARHCLNTILPAQLTSAIENLLQRSGS